jgi:Na+-translocating ferredoxin:NAD+ oxidoreductase RnfD subunit
MSFAIVIMNITVPLIDKYIRPRAFGVERRFLSGRKNKKEPS